MSNVFRTEEYEKSGKTVNWLDEFISSFSQSNQILDLIYDKRGETVESVVNKYKEMVGLEKTSSQNIKLDELGGVSKEDKLKIKNIAGVGKSVVVEITSRDRTPSGKFRHVGSPKEVKMAKLIKHISKLAKDESENESVIVMIEKNPKIKTNLHSICEHSGGHRNTISIINFLRNMLGKELVSFSDEDLKNYIEDIKDKYKEELVEQEADAGLVGLDDTSSEDDTADYITHGKGNM